MTTHHTHFNPGATWLITPKARPGWIAILNLLDDGEWHPTHDVAHAMRAATNFAPRTIENHLRSAGVRRWISNSNGRVRLRQRHLLEAALDLSDGDR